MSVDAKMKTVRKQMSKCDKIAFAFICYGHPSLTEIKKFSNAYGVDLRGIFEALETLSRRGLIDVNQSLVGCCCASSYSPIFFGLTDTGDDLFQLNYGCIINFLIQPKLLSTSFEEAVRTLIANFVED